MYNSLIFISLLAGIEIAAPKYWRTLTMITCRSPHNYIIMMHSNCVESNP